MRFCAASMHHRIFLSFRQYGINSIFTGIKEKSPPQEIRFRLSFIGNTLNTKALQIQQESFSTVLSALYQKECDIVRAALAISSREGAPAATTSFLVYSEGSIGFSHKNHLRPSSFSVGEGLCLCQNAVKIFRNYFAKTSDFIRRKSICLPKISRCRNLLY